MSCQPLIAAYTVFTVLVYYCPVIILSLFTSLPLKSSVAMSKTYADQAPESQYFNWKCLICNELAHSPSELEMQHMVEYRPYTDISGDKWIKCDKCFNPYHIDCLQEYIPVGKYLCSFLGCKQ